VAVAPRCGPREDHRHPHHHKTCDRHRVVDDGARIDGVENPRRGPVPGQSRRPSTTSSPPVIGVAGRGEQEQLIQHQQAAKTAITKPTKPAAKWPSASRWANCSPATPERDHERQVVQQLQQCRHPVLLAWIAAPHQPQAVRPRLFGAGHGVAERVACHAPLPCGRSPLTDVRLTSHNRERTQSVKPKVRSAATGRVMRPSPDSLISHGTLVAIAISCSEPMHAPLRQPRHRRIETTISRPWRHGLPSRCAVEMAR
jgi:hypothetical protein